MNNKNPIYLIEVSSKMYDRAVCKALSKLDTNFGRRAFNSDELSNRIFDHFERATKRQAKRKAKGIVDGEIVKKNMALRKKGIAGMDKVSQLRREERSH